MSWGGPLLAASLLCGANYADYRTTVDALQRGGREANPVADTVGIAPIKIIGTAAEMAIFMQLRKRHKHGAWVFVGSVVLVNVGIAIHNSRVK